MKYVVIIFGLLVFFSCSGGSDNSDVLSAEDIATKDDSAANDSEGAGDHFNVYEGTPKDGNYSFENGDNESISLNISEGKYFFILDFAFVCEGGNENAPCKYKSSIKELTCNQAFQKGYFKQFEENKFEIQAKDGKFEFYITGEDTIEGIYHLDPGMCCKKDFYFQATWKNGTICKDFTKQDCDPLKNTGCEEGFHCTYDSDNKPVCFKNGEVETGGDCKLPTDCKEGICVDIGNTGSKCYKFCEKHADCYPQTCMDLSNSSWKVCTLPQSSFKKCNLLTQDCEKDGYACYISSITTPPSPICLQAGSKTQDEDCQSDSDCAKGYLCHVDKKCRKICNLNSSSGEPKCDDEFQNCISVYPLQSAGVCK